MRDAYGNPMIRADAESWNSGQLVEIPEEMGLVIGDICTMKDGRVEKWSGVFNENTRVVVVIKEGAAFVVAGGSFSSSVEDVTNRIGTEA